jgi:periplasmic protein TonB
VKALLRWMPLSIAVHAVAIGAGTYVVRSAIDSALFVDLTLDDAGRGGDQRPAGAAAAPSGTSRGPARPPRSGGALGASRALAPTSSSPPRADSASATAPAPPSTEMATPPETPAPPVVPTPPAFPAPMTSESISPPTPPEPSAFSGPGRGEPAGTAGGEMRTGQGGGLAGAEGNAAAGGAGKGMAGGGEGRGEGRVALAVPGDAGADAYGPYLATVRQRIQDTLAYPPAARRRGLSGTVNLEISIDARGRVSDVLVVRSSSHALLDDAAVDAARGLRRIPFPPDVRPRALRVRLPVKFELH